jgi:hypothetical protein
MYNIVAIIFLDREWCGKKGVGKKDKKKRELELSPNILVTRNPNRSQNSGKKIDCVKERY